MARRMISSAIPVSSEDDDSVAQRVWPYVAPWAGAATLWPAAAITHEMWGTDPSAVPWVSASMALGSAALTWLTSKITTGRPSVQVHATLTTGAACTWTTASTIVGPGTHPLLDAWLLGGAAVALSWNLRKLLRGKDKDGTNTESEFFKSIKMAKTKVRGEITVAPNRVDAHLQLPPGEMTADEAADAKVRGRIASKLSISPNAVRMVPDPDHHDRVKMTITPVDLLTHGAPWTGPSAFGGSISQPLIIGVYEDGEPEAIYLPGDKTTGRQAGHYLVIGMNGSGKSHGAKYCWTEILTRHDAVLWVADPAKGKQTLRDYMDHIDWAAITPDEGEAMIEALPDVIRERADWLGEHGFDQWEEGCGIPYLVVWFEEASTLARDSSTLIDIAQTARSAGITLVLSLQRPSHKNMTTDLRSQMGNVLCFGVKDIADAMFVVDEDVLDAGADPSVWKNGRPGYNVLDAVHLDIERRATPARTFNGSEADMLAAIEAFAPHRSQADPATVAGGGEAYANRRKTAGKGEPYANHQAGKAPDMTVRLPRKPKDPFAGRITDEEDTTPMELPENHEPDLIADADTELPELIGEFDFPKQKYTPSQASELLVQVLTELHAQGMETVGPKDIPQSFKDNVRTRPWISPEMARLADHGILLETDREGVYRFSPKHFPALTNV
jgi:hypothetical protein